MCKRLRYNLATCKLNHTRRQRQAERKHENASAARSRGPQGPAAAASRSRGVLARPFPSSLVMQLLRKRPPGQRAVERAGGRPKTYAVLLVLLGNLGNQRIVRVRIRQKRANGQQHCTTNDGKDADRSTGQADLWKLSRQGSNCPSKCPSKCHPCRSHCCKSKHVDSRRPRLQPIRKKNNSPVIDFGCEIDFGRLERVVLRELNCQ